MKIIIKENYVLNHLAGHFNFPEIFPKSINYYILTVQITKVPKMHL